MLKLLRLRTVGGGRVWRLGVGLGTVPGRPLPRVLCNWRDRRDEETQPSLAAPDLQDKDLVGIRILFRIRILLQRLCGGDGLRRDTGIWSGALISVLFAKSEKDFLLCTLSAGN